MMILSSFAFVAPPSAPSTPTGLATDAGHDSVVLDWDETTGAHGYRVYRDDVLIATITGKSTTSYNDSGLTPGTEYEYKVSAWNPGGESALSTGVAALVFWQVDSVNAANRTTNAFDLEWIVIGSGTPDTVRYQIQATGGDWMTLLDEDTVTGATGAMETAISGLSGGYDVDVRLRVEDGSDVGEWTTLTHVSLDSPQNLEAEIGDEEITLTWDAYTGADSYKVYRDGVEVDEVMTTSFNDTGLTNWTEYEYWVTAIVDAVESAASHHVFAEPAIIIETLAIGPNPGGPNSANDDYAADAFWIHWSMSTPADADVHAQAAGGDWSSLVYDATVTTASFPDRYITGLSPNTEYDVRVQASADGGTHLGPWETLTGILTLPAEPTGLSTAPGGTSEVILNWDDVAGVTWKVYRGPDAVFANATLLDGAVATNTYSDTGASLGIEYYYFLKATNASGDSDPCDGVPGEATT